MTVSSSVGRQWTIGQLITRAYRYAGLVELSMEPRPDQVRYAQGLLEDILDELDADTSVSARTVEMVNVTLIPGTFEYLVDAKYIDLVSPGMYIDPSNTDTTKAEGETPVEVVSREEWQRYSTKAATGRVYKVWNDRVGDQMKLVLWPIPDEAATIRFQMVRELADVNNTTATFDLRNYWMTYLRTKLAALLARSGSLPQAGDLFAEAEQAYRKAKSFANQRPDNQIYMSHQTGYRRRR